VKCRKIIGDYRGWLGAQCMCELPTGSGTKGAHSIGTLR
jgi:hypothetical protein